LPKLLSNFLRIDKRNRQVSYRLMCIKNKRIELEIVEWVNDGRISYHS